MRSVNTNKPPVNQECLWDSASLSEALGVNVPIGICILNVSIDSRTLGVNSLFIAIRGKNFNGNNFADEAIKRGALLCIVDEINEDNKKFEKQLILVNDTLEALNKLAAFARNRVKGNVICITGSVGKTSTKEMLKMALECQAKIHVSIGNYNNHYGLPLTMANMPKDIDYAILEMGMSAKDELQKLSYLAKPDIAIITNVESAHLGFFSSVSAIAAAKAEIFDGMSNGGVAIINFDNPYYQILVNHALDKKLRIVSFAEENNADYQLLSCTIESGISDIVIRGINKDIQYKIGTIGKHLAFNSMIAIATMEILGMDICYGANKLIGFKPQRGRGQVHEIEDRNLVLIDDTYNANPASVKAAINYISNYRHSRGRSRSILILGDMLELGNTSIFLHTSLLKEIIFHKISVLHTVGTLMRSLYDTLPANLKGLHAETSSDLARVINNYIDINDVILVKGSNKMKMNIIVDAILENVQNAGN